MRTRIPRLCAPTPKSCHRGCREPSWGLRSRRPSEFQPEKTSEGCDGNAEQRGDAQESTGRLRLALEFAREHRGLDRVARQPVTGELSFAAHRIQDFEQLLRSQGRTKLD